MRRDDIFVSRDTIKIALIPEDKLGLAPNHNESPKDFSDIDFATFRNPSSLSNIIDNSNASIMSWRDLFLAGYYTIDLARVPRQDKPSNVLDKLDVNGFFYSRPYMNDNIAKFHDDLLKVIWSIPADQTSANAYRNLLRHAATFPNEAPFGWFVRGSIKDKLMKPIADILAKTFQSEFRLSSTVTSIVRVPTAGSNSDDCFNVEWHSGGQSNTKSFKYIVMATPSNCALPLLLSDQSVLFSDGGPLKEAVRKLPLLREAKTARIPVVYLRLNPEFVSQMGASLSSLPAELIGFKIAPSAKTAAGDDVSGSTGGNPESPNYDLSILNLTALWDDKKSEAGLTLVVAASDSAAIFQCGPDELANNVTDGGTKQGFAIIKKLSEYLPFMKVGNEWNDRTHGIHVDWDNTRVITNVEHGLFLNDADSNVWRPGARVDGLKNIFFAGDYCRTDVDMATVEAAVQSGVLAAQALQAAAGQPANVVLQPHDIYSSSPLVLIKMAATPLAFLTALSRSYDEAGDDLAAALTFPATGVALAARYWADWLQTAVQFWANVIPANGGSSAIGAAGQSSPDPDHRMGVGEWALNAGLALAIESPRLAPLAGQVAGDALYSALYWTVGRTLFPKLRAKPPPMTPLQVNRSPSTPPARPTLVGLFKQTYGATAVTPATVKRAAFQELATILIQARTARTEPAVPPASPVQEFAKALFGGGSKPAPSRDTARTRAVAMAAQLADIRDKGYVYYPVERDLVFP